MSGIRPAGILPKEARFQQMKQLQKYRKYGSFALMEGKQQTEYFSVKFGLAVALGPSWRPKCWSAVQYIAAGVAKLLLVKAF